LIRALAALAALAAAPAAARAQADSTAFSVERFTPAPGAGGFLAAEDADVLPRLRWTAAAAGSLMSRPIVLRSLVDGAEATAPVAVRLGYDLSAAIGLGTRYQLGVALPVVVQDGDRLQAIGLDERPLDPVTVGDLRLHGKLRLLGAPGAAGSAVGAALVVSLPTGDGGDFAGEAGWVIEWRLIGSHAARWWRAAIDVGPRFRTREVVLLSPARPHGNELCAAAAAEVMLPRVRRHAASLLAEYSYVRGDAPRGGGTRGPSPGELRLGARWRTAAGWSLLAGLGLGTTPDEVGSPAWRLILAARFTAPR
jgi:hypothetical protein